MSDPLPPEDAPNSQLSVKTVGGVQTVASAKTVGIATGSGFLKRWLPHVLELIRFGSVGVATAVLYFVLFWLIQRLAEFPEWLTGALSYGPCLVANYVGHRVFTFRSSSSHGHAGPRYLVIQLGGLLINSLVLWLGESVWKWTYWPSQILAIVLLAAFSYVGQRFWTFAEQE